MYPQRNKVPNHRQSSGQTTLSVRKTLGAQIARWLCGAAVFCYTAGAGAQENGTSLRFRVMEWNVENLFDTRHDSLKNDQEFLPDGLRRWNHGRYKKKLDDLARGIAAVGEWEAPALVGLCEVENDRVLHDLTRHSPLKEFGYRYIVTNSPDARGIDVALLYQRDLFKLIAHRSIPIPAFRDHRPTRDVLHVSGLLLTGDTLDVMVCHLPSRSEGVAKTEPYRMHAAGVVRATADSLLATRQHPQLIVMGDFNDYPADRSICQVLEAEAPPAKDEAAILPHKLYHLLARKSEATRTGTYKYSGEWGLLDHLIVSGTLLQPEARLCTSEEQAHIAHLPFLLTEDDRYGGEQPYRMYRGMKYQGGISDHLPIYADFELKLP